MWSKLEEVFIELNLPYSRQGSYGEGDSLPASFFTFSSKVKSPVNLDAHIKLTLFTIPAR